MVVNRSEETFTYTHEYTVDSSVIEGVYYNANDGYVVLDVGEEFYLYKTVTQADVEDLVEGDENGSVGAYYNRVWKSKFGPGEHLGNWYDWDEFYEDTRETPQQAFDRVKAQADAVVNGYQLENHDVTREFSLQPIPEKAVGVSDVESATTVVYFNLPDVGDKEFQFKASTSDVYEAVDELHEYVSRIGQRGAVKRVVVEFG